jgi:steroid 5-alpha reductase family enzyme
MNGLDLSFWSMIGIELAITISLMILVFAFAQKINNYSVVDAAWCQGFTILATFTLFAGHGYPVRRILIFLTVAIWSKRLGFMLARRIYHHHPAEDGRYHELRKGYAPNVKRGFFIFYMIQGFSVVLLSVPFLLISQNEMPALSSLEIAGVYLWALSLFGERMADHQLAKFKQNPNNRGKTCQVGLWKYSRHPNYFFETCIWFSFYVIALGTPGTWFTIYCPLIMLVLVTKVSGIPPSEAQALKSRGEEFRAYQRRTSAFVPWFPKSGE